MIDINLVFDSITEALKTKVSTANTN